MLSGFAIAEPDNSIQDIDEQIQQEQQAPAAPKFDKEFQSVNSGEPPMSIPEKNMNQLKNIGQNTPQNKFLKFVIAMFGVLISGLAVYGGLKLYKSFIMKKNSLNINPNDDRILESPKDFKTAINIFLNKTDI